MQPWLATAFMHHEKKGHDASKHYVALTGLTGEQRGQIQKRASTADCFKQKSRYAISKLTFRALTANTVACSTPLQDLLIIKSKLYSKEKLIQAISKAFFGGL